MNNKMEENPYHRHPFDDIIILGFENKYTVHIQFQGTKYYRRIYDTYDEEKMWIWFLGDKYLIKDLERQQNGKSV